MSKKHHETIYRKDYLPPAYEVDTIHLDFDLGKDVTIVSSKLVMIKNKMSMQDASPLQLYGRDLQLKSIHLDDKLLKPEEYVIDEEKLTIAGVPESFTLEIVTQIKPQENSSLEGLYKSSGIFCTQCEAQGFRKITFYPDRPDVMARFSTTISADKNKYPVLLSNGNLIDAGDLENGRHFAKWEDPFKKPSYLFALVAGGLVKIEGSFRTFSGRDVALQIFVEKRNENKCDHAMSSLKKSMKWDEETFGLEYDLDIYMILAVDDFNMGAMENKGLNIFNSKYVLARPDTATDADFEAIEEVIGHEYFHNWTGNRVTCRDWFQLSLKEGLTVFRDQEFSADMTSRAVKRIENVRLLRNSQFPEDGGPMAHPIRPDSFVEINNFYTTTIYNKGAEVIRMMHTLLGQDGFRKGMDLYIKRHDGQAVTCDDFVLAMEEANDFDLTQFRRWYSQAGTPELHIEDDYDEEAGIYTLTIKQLCPPTPGQEKKAPFHIPLALGLLDRQGKNRPLHIKGEKEETPVETKVISLYNKEESFSFTGIFHRPVPSLLRSFSAPVKLKFNYSDEDLAFLMANDSDSFSRWEAGQQLALRIMLKLVREEKEGKPLTLDDLFIDSVRKTVEDKKTDRALLAQALILPTETYLAEQMEIIDPQAIRNVRKFVSKALAQALKEEFLVTYNANCSEGEYAIDPKSIGHRSLKNICLGYLMKVDEKTFVTLCINQFRKGQNMTDVMASLTALTHFDGLEREEALKFFYTKWKKDPLVIDKWFSIQALSTLPGTLNHVKKLITHADFNIKNPNRVRSLIGAFSHGNMAAFHNESGEGYEFLTQQVLIIDSFNPQVAARMVTPFSRWKRYDSGRQNLIRKQLERIKSTKEISNDVYEIVTKSLG